jgi:hypothetical protein
MTTQRNATVSEFISWADEYCKGVKVLITALGDEDTEGTAIHYAANVRDMVTALDQPDEAQLTADLIDPAIAVVAALAREAAIGSFYAAFNQGMRAHLGSDLNTWLAADGTRVNSYWKRAGDTSLLPVNCCPPVTVLGAYAVSGSGTGTLTDGAAVDTVKYGGAQIQLRVTGQQIGAASIDVSVTCTTASGSTVTRTGTITNGSEVDTLVELGTAADRIVDITAVTISGGTAGDDFQIETMEDRTI